MQEYRGKILMLLENDFPGDVRPKNQACLLTNAGYKVTVIALKEKGEKWKEEVDGVTVYRIPKLTIFRKTRNQDFSLIHKFLNKVKSVIGYISEYFYFTFSCLILSLYILWEEGFDVIHTHNPPDTLVIVGAFFKLFGKKYVFDHHDLSPELYLSRLGIKNRSGLIYQGLIFAEKLCLKFADAVIATNESYKAIEVERGEINPEKIFIVRNGPDLNRVRRVPPDDKLKKRGRIILGYVGCMNPQDGVDYLLRSLKYLIVELKRTDFFCVNVGCGDSLEDLKSMTRELDLENHVWFTGFVPDEDMIRYLSTADIFLDPDPSSPLNDVSTWIKIMEYMALEKPIVSFDLKESRFSAQEAALFVPPNDEGKFAEAIAKLMDDPDLRKKMGDFGKKRVQNELKWEIVGQNLLNLYKNLNI